MTSQTTTVKNGAIKLPEELRTLWENAEVYISGERDNISIKRLSAPPLSSMLDEMNKAGQDISADDINDALRTARKK
jgi:hypothetical protein